MGGGRSGPRLRLAAAADDIGAVRAAMPLEEIPGCVSPTVADHRNVVQAVDVSDVARPGVFWGLSSVNARQVR